ncbi:GGDEF domain-containing phosphodiesterase [Actinotalea sp. K2]|uniref:putative bifunctional diguanylate cyclase/phosphodiesterase n=1 Tax=Actinotalea sp. K2 TaxID=2939438 RepID=UPI002017A340|nr:GGDEF domain-containing phosphodiesterase [Actinotalea sp. K2]MCL3862923.1 EAL domain-containing protein [Actinotalea sp. K2]
MGARRRATWVSYLTLGAALVVVELALPDGLARDSLYTLVAGSAAVAIVVGVRMHRPRQRTAWYLMAAGIACWAVGDGLWALFAHVLLIEPFPSVADAAYLLGYPLLAAGMLQLSVSRRRHRDLAPLLDAFIVATGVGLVLYVVFIEPGWGESQGELLHQAVAVAYPLGDVILLTQLVHLGASVVIRTWSLRMLGAAFVLVLVADILFQAMAFAPELESQIAFIDPLWLVAYVLWGAAALHPSMARAMVVEGAHERAFTPGRLWFLATAIVLLPVTILVEAMLGLPLHSTAVSVAGIIMIALVLTRMIGLVRRMRDQARRLAQLADTDFLTGLDNRRHLGERLADRLDGRVQTAPGPTVLAVGIEGFAEINETLGHRVGDELLRSVAARLRDLAEQDVAVARLGGDVFGLLLPAGRPAGEVLVLAHDLRAHLVEPMTVDALTLTIEVAVGVVIADAEHDDADHMLHRADVALATARELPGRVAVHDAAMDEGVLLAPALMAELRAALEAGDLVVHFQPQVEIGTGRVFGAEALVRWQHPTHGLLPPMAFIPAAERTGLIRQLTMHVLDRSLAQCARWRGEGRPLSVSVNLSVRNLLDPHLVDDVRAALDRHGLDPSVLELELTETMAMVDPVRSGEVLGALDDLGVTLSIDDYGTGYGSLAYLQRLPVRRLKIDRSFVTGVLDDPASAAIVRSTIDLARQLGLSVVAEGVEDDATLLHLRDMDCFAAQGFGIGRPMPEAAVGRLIDDIDARLPGLLDVRPLIPTPVPGD